VPCHNEQGNIEPFYQEVTKIMGEVPYDYELILVDDGSRDGTPIILRKLQAEDPHVKPLELVRNFGKEIAVTAGLHESHGEAAIILDADLQHPPDLIPEFLHKWERLNEVVVGVRLPTKKHTSLPKRIFSKVFYGIMRRIAHTPITPNATDYRLLDRLVIDEFNRFTEHNRLTRGLVDWLGFKVAHVYFHPPKRHSGRPSYNYRKLFELALSSFVSMSLFPLKLGGYVGLIITIVAGIAGVFIFVEHFWLNDPLGLNITGTAMLAVLNMFLVGLILVGQGLMALYVANIYGEVVNRPLYVVRRGRPFPAQTKAAIATPAPAESSAPPVSREQPAFGEVRQPKE
jgi:dolichol-phosphate mannosyltransferase